MNTVAPELDLDVLTQRPELNRPVIYIYRSGALRRPMRRLIEAQFLRDQRLYAWLTARELTEHIAGPNLFGLKAAAGVDLGTGHVLSEGSILDIKAAEPVLVCVLIDEQNSFASQLTSPEIVKHCHIIREVKTNRRNLAAILRFFQRTSDLKGAAGSVLDANLMASTSSYADEGDLWAIANQVDQALSVATYAAKTELEDLALAPVVAETYYAMLRGLLSPSSKFDAEDFVIGALGRLQTGTSRSELVGHLTRAMQRILKLETEKLSLSAQLPGLSPRKLIQLCIAILRWLEQLPQLTNWYEPTLGADTFLSSLRRLVGAATRVDSEPMIIGNMSDKLELIQRYDGSTSLSQRYETVAEHLRIYLEALQTRANADWILNLLNALAPAVEEKFAASQPSIEPACAAACSFDDFGRAGNILRRLVKARKIETPIILTGESHADLKCLAATFAKSILCSAPIAGSACCSCMSCRNFDAGSHMGYVASVNISGPTADMLMDQLRDKSKSNRIAEHTIIILDRIAQSRPATLDRLLKSIEEPPSDVTYVLLVSDMKGIKPAVRSRNHVVRVRQTSS